MLGTLAKWLRILGYDTLFNPAWTDHQLARLARSEGRVLLTRDRELSRRRGFGSLLITSESLDEQIRQVLETVPGTGEAGIDACGLASRCPVCNDVLQVIDRETACALVPPYVAQTQKSFSQCPGCRRVYWRGTHWQHMLEYLERIRQ